MLMLACLALWALPLQAAPAAVTNPLFLPEPARPDWIHADKALQMPVTLSGQPLKVRSSSKINKPQISTTIQRLST